MGFPDPLRNYRQREFSGLSYLLTQGLWMLYGVQEKQLQAQAGEKNTGKLLCSSAKPCFSMLS